MKQYSTIELEKILADANLSSTVQRLSLLRFILTADHPTKDEIVAYAEKHLEKVNKATVYNTINALEKAKIIKKIKFPHLSQTVYDHNINEHHHFLDEVSGRIIDIESSGIEIKAKLSNNFKVESYDILVRGKLIK